jgi:apolipoprotein D and lipocalin family protein
VCFPDVKMRNLFLQCVALIVLAAGLALPAAAMAADPLPVVESVDFQRYAGKWYEIARLPNFFQRKCVGDVSAEYSLREDGLIRVYNQCALKNGGADSVDGVARPIDMTGPNSRLEVSFLPRWLRWVPFTWGAYWVMELGADYEYAVVGTPNRGYLWILARKQEMDDALYAQILERVRALGFDASAVVRTMHTAP